MNLNRFHKKDKSRLHSHNTVLWILTRYVDPYKKHDHTHARTHIVCTNTHLYCSIFHRNFYVNPCQPYSWVITWKRMWLLCCVLPINMATFWDNWLSVPDFHYTVLSALLAQILTMDHLAHVKQAAVEDCHVFGFSSLGRYPMSTDWQQKVDVDIVTYTNMVFSTSSEAKQKFRCPDRVEEGFILFTFLYLSQNKKKSNSNCLKH